tara:strand:- start:2618 stop:2818 length:201 start_codon:yes stop_codon:yes gene_type:complete
MGGRLFVKDRKMNNASAILKEFGFDNFTVSQVAELLETPNAYWIIKDLERDERVYEVSKNVFCWIG